MFEGLFRGGKEKEESNVVEGSFGTDESSVAEDPAVTQTLQELENMLTAPSDATDKDLTVHIKTRSGEEHTAVLRGVTEDFIMLNDEHNRYGGTKDLSRRDIETIERTGGQAMQQAA
jgi:hypothetical protein